MAAVDDDESSALMADILKVCKNGAQKRRYQRLGQVERYDQFEKMMRYIAHIMLEKFRTRLNHASQNIALLLEK